MIGIISEKLLTKARPIRARTKSNQLSHHSFLICYNLCVDGIDSYSNVAFVLTIIFVTIANILLLNVLIGLFK
jgi:hypothetical protein